MEYWNELRVKDLSFNSSFATNQLYDLRKTTKLVWASKNSSEEWGFESWSYLRHPISPWTNYLSTLSIKLFIHKQEIIIITKLQGSHKDHVRRSSIR